MIDYKFIIISLREGLMILSSGPSAELINPGIRPSPGVLYHPIPFHADTVPRQAQILLRERGPGSPCASDDSDSAIWD